MGPIFDRINIFCGGRYIGLPAAAADDDDHDDDDDDQLACPLVGIERLLVFHRNFNFLVSCYRTIRLKHGTLSSSLLCFDGALCTFDISQETWAML